MRIMQGDQYAIPFELEDTQGEAILLELIDTVEIVIGAITKTYPDEISFSDGKFLFPISQEESFSMRNITSVQVRIKFSNGDVVGTSLKSINVLESVSKEVL